MTSSCRKLTLRRGPGWSPEPPGCFCEWGGDNSTGGSLEDKSSKKEQEQDDLPESDGDDGEVSGESEDREESQEIIRYLERSVGAWHRTGHTVLGSGFVAK